jgi:hypothetical protein
VTFLSILGLGVALLVFAPYFAHRLRRRRAQEMAFAPAFLVAPTPPQARRRSKLEDRGLLAVRAASVLALALLGATPFVRCSRLSLQRTGGASIAMAIVVDDSMSMRAPLRPGTSRFRRAKQGARELLASAREGDAVALVLAGAPARVALAATTDLGLARTTIDALAESDRGTDLDGALMLAEGLVSSLAQADRRIVVLSDLADGHAEDAPLGQSTSIPVWVALPDLLGPAFDCAVLRADRKGVRVRVSYACGPGGTMAGREVVVEDAAGKPLGRASTGSALAADATVLLPSDEVPPARARLTGTDAIASDDVAPVLPEIGRGAIAVVTDAATESVATGGAPVVEQALSALKLGIDLHPLPAVPDRAEDLAPYLGVLLDDPPGLTPEQRHALGAFLGAGGITLLALGPRAASAPLGASLAPVLTSACAWTDTKSRGADPASAAGEWAEAVRSLEDIGAMRRATLGLEDIRSFEALVRWSDGAPLVARREVERGLAWLVTLPFSVDASDLTLRPAFLALLEAWVRAARERAAPQRSDVGAPWVLTGARRVEAEGPDGPVASSHDEGAIRIVPSLIGAYHLTVDGKDELRVAAPIEREIDMRPRPLAPSAAGHGMGERRVQVDISGQVALVLLVFFAAELGLRIQSRARTKTA